MRCTMLQLIVMTTCIKHSVSVCNGSLCQLVSLCAVHCCVKFLCPCVHLVAVSHLVCLCAVDQCRADMVPGWSVLDHANHNRSEPECDSAPAGHHQHPADHRGLYPSPGE